MTSAVIQVWRDDLCACAPRCDGGAERTAYSPYMDDYCHDCTLHRCDAVGGHVDAARADGSTVSEQETST